MTWLEMLGVAACVGAIYWLSKRHEPSSSGEDWLGQQDDAGAPEPVRSPAEAHAAPPVADTESDALRPT